MADGSTTIGGAADTHTEGSGRRLPLAGLAAMIVIVTNAVTFLFPPLLPVIQAQYQVSTVSAVTWIFTLMTLGGGASFIVLPKMSDLVGDRKTAVLACAVLTAGALVAAVGDSYPALLAGSAIMGFGGAAQLLPLGFLRRGLGEAGLALSVAIVVMATGVGIVVGMIGGGFIVEHLPLRDFFFILAACFAITTVAAALILPRSKPDAAVVGHISVLATIWLIACVGAILLALTQGVVWGAAALIPLVLGVVGTAAWVRVEQRASKPVFDRALVKSPVVILASIVIALIAAVNAEFLVLLSTFAQVDPSYLEPADAYGLGLTALKTGVLMVPFAITFLIGGAVAEKPVASGRGLTVFVAGAVVTAAGLALMVVQHDQQWAYLVASGIVGLGCSAIYSACFAVAQYAVREEKAGEAAAMVGTAMAIGFAIGSAIATTVLGAAVVPIVGTELTVGAKSQYGVGYWIGIGLTGLIVVTVAVLGRRSSAAARLSRI